MLTMKNRCQNTLITLEQYVMHQLKGMRVDLGTAREDCDY